MVMVLVTLLGAVRILASSTNCRLMKLPEAPLSIRTVAVLPLTLASRRSRSSVSSVATSVVVLISFGFSVDPSPCDLFQWLVGQGRL